MDSSSSAEAISKLITVIGDWWQPLQDIVILSGIVLVAIGLFSARKAGKQGTSVKLAVFEVIAGILLASIPAWMDTLSQTAFQQNGPSAITTASASSSTGDYHIIVTFGFDVLMLVGLYGIVTGILLLRDSAEDRSKFRPFLTHTIGGIVALNMETFLITIGNTVGGTFQAMITHVIGS